MCPRSCRNANPFLRWMASCGPLGCKNTAHSVSCLETVKGAVCFVSNGSFFCSFFVFRVYVVFCFLVFGCQYQCKWLPGKTRSGMTCYVSSGMLNPTQNRSRPNHFLGWMTPCRLRDCALIIQNCVLWGCKNRAHFIFWLEVVKAYQIRV